MTVLEDLEGSDGQWPPPEHANRLAVQRDHGRLYRNRRDEILAYWSADLIRWIERQDELVPYPAARIASHTLASFLFGEDPVITHDDDDVRDAIGRWSVDTNLAARLLEGAITQAYEGEVYYRPAWDDEIDPQWAIPTVVPGSRVLPRFRYGILVDAAIVTAYDAGDGMRVWRHVEQHVRGGIVNRLFAGTADTLGDVVPLDRISATSMLEDEVDTGVDELLMTHVPLFRTAADSHGVSLLAGTEALIIGLHRLYSDEQHDAEISRKRIALPASYVSRDSSGRPQWDRRTDLFLLSENAEGAVGEKPAPATPIEFSDNTVQRERIRGRLEDFLLACGISPQTILPEQTGSAISGTARKLAQATTLRTVAATARYQQAAIARLVAQSLAITAANLDSSVPTVSDDLPSVALSDGLIDDPAELARILLDLDSAEAISLIEKVRALHPDWTETQIEEEVERIDARTPASPPPPQFGSPPPAAPEDDDGEPVDEVDDETADA